MCAQLQLEYSAGCAVGKRATRCRRVLPFRSPLPVALFSILSSPSLPLVIPTVTVTHITASHARSPPSALFACDITEPATSGPASSTSSSLAKLSQQPRRPADDAQPVPPGTLTCDDRLRLDSPQIHLASVAQASGRSRIAFCDIVATKLWLTAHDDFENTRRTKIHHSADKLQRRQRHHPTPN